MIKVVWTRYKNYKDKFIARGDFYSCTISKLPAEGEWIRGSLLKNMWEYSVLVEDHVSNSEDYYYVDWVKTRKDAEKLCEQHLHKALKHLIAERRSELRTAREDVKRLQQHLAALEKLA